MTELDKVLQQLLELSTDDVIKMLQTGVVSIFEPRCNYCIYKGKCSNTDYYNRSQVEYSCGIGMYEFLKMEC